MVRNLELAPALTILALPFALGAVVTAIMLLRRRRTRPTRQPTCGQFGYNVTGLSTFTCPECGSDLRQVGIRGAAGPSLKPGPSRAGLVFKLSLWGLVVICVLGLGAQSLFDLRWAQPTAIVGLLKCNTPGRPYSALSISYDAATKIDLRLSFPRKQPIDLRANLQADRLTYRHLKTDDVMVERTGPVTAATLLAAMR